MRSVRKIRRSRPPRHASPRRAGAAAMAETLLADGGTVGFAEGENLEIDLGQARYGHPQLLGRAIGEIDDASLFHQVAAVGDADHDRTVIPPVDHPHDRPKGKCGVARGHGVHVVDFAARRFAAVKDAAVPGSYAMDPVLPPLGFGRRSGLRNRGLGMSD